QPRHHAQGRGLAGAVRPEQRVELAGAHGEVEPVDRRAVEALGEAADLEAVGRAGGEHATLAWMAMRGGYAGSGFGRMKSTRQIARRGLFTKKRARRPPHLPWRGRIAWSGDQEHLPRTNVRLASLSGARADIAGCPRCATSRHPRKQTPRRVAGALVLFRRYALRLPL